ncbi:mucin-like protein [Physella acuta]|uniref:mucin-like protein n=1 Tax=Physella acuta TaxID=109671 RepID=UPI0027DB269B|nr:mucin-like protein [Physella acuta]
MSKTIDCDNVNGSCSCIAGWSGASCNQTDCNDTSGACLCKGGWNGTNCELDINECLNKSYCRGIHEECHNLQGTAECQCELGFENKTGFCQVCNTTSYGFYCGNKCSCVMNNTIDCNDTTGSCLCALGWTGTKCDTDINECLSTSYCVGLHEKCNNLNGSAECKCVPGYEKTNGACQVCNKTHYGLDCSLKCACVMENTKYCNGTSGACLCSPGWNGTNCEKDINECDNKNYCTEVHASCFNLNGSAECRCDNGYQKLSSGNRQALCPNCTDVEVCFNETAGKWICRLNDSRIYPYGLVQNDQSLPKNKELASANLYIEDFIPYQLKLISSITVNGLISFDEEYSSFNPQKLPVLDKNLNQRSLLAVYWTDLDVNDNDNCEVYYQMYDLYSNKTLGIAVFTKANADVMALTENKSYNATTVIVVTWVNIPAHGSVDERVSFQCVIISDGYTTYAIYIYIQGAMKFKPLSARNVEVGWANFSFDTSLTSYYRFDTVLGNTGKPGLWIFKVGENKNFKMMCRTWFISNQGELPTIDLWNKNLLPACPCNEVAAKSSPICVPSSLAYLDRTCFDLLPFFGEYGRRCCYKADESSSFLNTIPQAGSLQRYNSFIYKEHDQLDEDPKDWCCTKSNLCDLYYTLRPIFSCNGSNWARGFLFGDPHIITMDQRSFIFNGLGEYHLVQIIGTTNPHFKLQGRTCRALNSNGNETLATVWCALSMTSGDENSLRVEISPSRKIMIIYANKRDYTTEFLSNPNLFTNDNKMILRKQNGALEVSLLESIGITVTMINELLEFSLTLDKKHQKMTTGLLGNFNGDKTDDFICPNGTQLSDDSSEKQLYEYGKLWAITQNESLFQYSYGQNTSTFSNPNFTPLFYDEQNPTTIAEAEKICNGSGNLPCIFDFIATQNEKIAETSLKSSDQFEKVSVSTANQAPNIIVNTTHVRATVNQSFSLTLTAFDPDGQDVTILFSSSDSKGLHSESIAINISACSGCSYCGTCDEARLRATLNPYFYWEACNCNIGFAGTDCEKDNDGCATNPCPSMTGCVDIPASEEQVTGLSYTYVDECKNTPPCGANAICKNNYGSFVCNCLKGFRKSGSLNCADINECSEKSHDCDQICVNNLGSYDCRCYPGFARTGGKCELTEKDIDECKEKICSQICINTNGSFSCSCFSGYTLNKNDLRSCDTCQGNTYGYNCSNTCQCKGRAVRCDNVKGCICQSNWKGETCETDVDECASKPDVCPADQKCTNTEGSYTCDCPVGYEDINGTCININECETRNTCPQTCIDTPGSFICECRDGFLKLPNGTCKDIDECEIDKSGCEQKCINVPGSSNCDCYPGYRLKDDRKTCEKDDVDPCENFYLNCSQGCTVTNGKAQCFCAIGYQLSNNQFDCLDIDECATQKLCNGSCINTPGSYNCSCPIGSKLQNDKKTCQECDEYHCGENCATECNCSTRGTSRCDPTQGCQCKAG